MIENNHLVVFFSLVVLSDLFFLKQATIDDVIKRRQARKLLQFQESPAGGGVEIILIADTLVKVIIWRKIRIYAVLTLF